jgi:cleavage and polyadenylation specificity factor subunit 1
VDASSKHIGAALQQRPYPAAPWQPLGFFSRKLDAMQVKYSAFYRELLACVSGFRHFRHLLGGRQFTIYTDHKPSHMLSPEHQTRGQGDRRDN